MLSSLNRPLAGDSMLIDLAAEIGRVRGSAAPARSARTLLKDGPMRVTLIVLNAGGDIAEHSAAGPITVHVLSGSIRFTIGGAEHRVATGQLITAGAGVRHAVAADEDAAFLLTVVQPQDD